MTPNDSDPRPVHDLLDRLPVPSHRPGFWDDLDRALAPGAPEAPAAPDTPPAAVAVFDQEAGPGHHQRRPRPRPPRPRHRWAMPAAAAALVVAAAVSLVLVLADDDGTEVRALDRPPVTTGTTLTADPEGAAAAVAAAEQVALQWLDDLAAGDMRAAWDGLGPVAREAWSSFERFEAARTGFAEGYALWASAEERRVGTATVATDGGPAVHVVTVTGVRLLEGTPEDGAVALAVQPRRPDGGLVVEPFAPTSAGIRIAQPLPRPQPPSVAPSTPVVVELPDGIDEVAFVLDRDGQVATVAAARSEASYAPPGGWAPGRHVVTAVVVDGPGAPMTATVVFEVG